MTYPQKKQTKQWIHYIQKGSQLENKKMNIIFSKLSELTMNLTSYRRKIRLSVLDFGLALLLVLSLLRIEQSLAQGDLSSILSDISCELACFLGIEPGVTTKSELEAILNERGIAYEFYPIGRGGHITSYNLTINDLSPFIPNSTVIPAPAGVMLGNDIVEQVDIRLINVSVNDVLADYGAPAVVGNVGAFVLVYPSRGLVFVISRTDPTVVDLVVIRTQVSTQEAFGDVAPCVDQPTVCNIQTATAVPTGNITPTVTETSTMTSTPSPTPTPAPAAAILFTSERDGNHEIYSMAADGSNVVRLTNSGGIDFYPTWFPDHSKIAFASTRNGNLDVYTMLADGSNVTQLTTSGGDDYGAQVSPDGTQMLFVSSRDGNLEIYRMNVDGTNQVRLTDNTVVESIPSWSPDGSKISFASFRDNNMELYTANPDGSSPTRLTNNSAQEYGPSWSPDGTRLAFVSTRDGNMEIYVMNVDGSNLTRLTTNSASDGFAVVGGTAYYGLAWSPDSSQLVFLSDRDGNVELYQMNADGTNPTRLTDASGVDSFPDW